MNLDQLVKMIIGEQVIQLAVAAKQIEAANERIKELESVRADNVTPLESENADHR